MEADWIQWILGSWLMVLTTVLGVVFRWLSQITKDLNDTRMHMAESYVRGLDLTHFTEKVESALAGLRVDVGEMNKVLHQLIGQNQRTGG